MKNKFKISTVSIICALCVSVMADAYGASSVRTLGGAGTYAGTASATQSAGSTGVARAGSVRISPTTVSKANTTTPANSASITAGRAAAAQRLSLGKYLGGTTAVSGGSSNRPNGSGTTNPGLSADLENRIGVLEDSVNDLKDTKQNNLVAGDYISIQDGEVFLDVTKLGQDTVASVEGDMLKLSIAGGNPVDLMSLSDLLTAADVENAIETALADKGFLNKPEVDCGTGTCVLISFNGTPTWASVVDSIDD